MKSVLIVEDSFELLNKIAVLLTHNNFNVIQSSNGSEGLNKAIEHIPDIIVADIMMPVMDGIEMLKRLKGNSLTADIPIIFLTAKAGYDDYRDGINKGADDYILKPFKSVELIASINRLIEKSKQISSKIDFVKSNILKNMPYKIRNSLINVIGYSEIIKSVNQDYDVNEITQTGDRLYNAGKTLFEQFEKYNLFAETEFLKVHKTKLLINDQGNQSSLQDVILNSCKNTTSLFKRDKDLSINLQNAYIKIDHYYLHILTKEIIENALTYSEEGSKINVNGYLNSDKYIISIENSIQHYNENIFVNLNEFISSSSPTNSNSLIGLGLLIIKNICDAYNCKFSNTIDSDKSIKMIIKIPLVIN